MGVQKHSECSILNTYEYNLSNKDSYGACMFFVPVGSAKQEDPLRLLLACLNTVHHIFTFKVLS